MAILHEATLRPTKLELLTVWLPGRDWFSSPPGKLERVAAFRFDDPAGEVGVETILVRSPSGAIYQVPLTYRGAPLEGGDRWLISTMDHSALGKRWVYDATGDPVYAATLASAILAGTAQAEEFLEVDGRLERREPLMTIASGAAGAPGGSVAFEVGAVERVDDGDPTRIITDTVELALARSLDAPTELTGTLLTGTWPGQETPVALASATLR